MATRHKYNEGDEVCAYYAYRCKKEGKKLEFSLEELIVARNLDKHEGGKLPLSSLIMRVSNYEFRDAGKGLRGWSKLAEQVYTKHKDIDFETLSKEVRKIVNNVK